MKTRGLIGHTSFLSFCHHCRFGIDDGLGLHSFHLLRFENAQPCYTQYQRSCGDLLFHYSLDLR